MVGTERKQERRADIMPPQRLDEPRHPLAGSAQGIDVDLEREAHRARALRYSTNARASATCARYASKMCLSAVFMVTCGFQSSSAQVLSIFGTRFWTSW